MNEVFELQRIYDAFLEELAQVIAKSKPTDGILGFGGGPKNDVCHQRFFEAVNAKAAEFAAIPVSAEIAAKLVERILGAQQKVKEDSLAYWTLLAGQGAAKPLIPLLTQEDAARLARWYEQILVPSRRMPLQDEVLSQLMTKGGIKETKKGLFGRWKK